MTLTEITPCDNIQAMTLPMWFPKLPRKLKKQQRKIQVAHLENSWIVIGFKYRLRWAKGMGWEVIIVPRKKNRVLDFRSDR